MCHVLIIEDEPLVALHLQETLAELGARSFAFAETEVEAVAKARLQRPDVITSDVRLREGTGPGAVRTIRDEMGPMPVIYMTGNPEGCVSDSALSRVLLKPLSDAAVRDAFRAVRP